MWGIVNSAGLKHFVCSVIYLMVFLFHILEDFTYTMAASILVRGTDMQGYGWLYVSTVFYLPGIKYKRSTCATIDIKLQHITVEKCAARPVLGFVDSSGAVC